MNLSKRFLIACCVSAALGITFGALSDIEPKSKVEKIVLGVTK